MRNAGLLTLFILLLGCTEKIDIDLDSSYTRLTVTGEITTDTTAHWVRLTQSADFYANEPVSPVKGAKVSISDGTETFVLNEVKDGYYLTDSNVYGVVGNTYILTIEHVDIDKDGDFETYTASSQLKNVGYIDSIFVTVFPYSFIDAYALKLNAKDPPSKDFYMFKTLLNGQRIKDTIDQLFITDDQFFNGNRTDSVVVEVLDQDRSAEQLNIGDTLVLEMCGITEAYYQFINEVREVTGFNNPIFGGPPANVSTNLSNGAVGFFAAYSITRDTLVFDGL